MKTKLIFEVSNTDDDYWSDLADMKLILNRHNIKFALENYAKYLRTEVKYADPKPSLEDVMGRFYDLFCEYLD